MTPFRAPLRLTITPNADNLPAGVTARTLTINVDHATDVLAGKPSAIDRVVIPWSRPSAHDHADATTSSLTLVAQPTDGTQVTIDALVLLEAQLAGSWEPILRGWVIAVESIPVAIPSGAYRYHVTLTNAVGRAASIRLAAKPWQPQDIGPRVQAIIDAMPVKGVIGSSLTGRYNYFVTLRGRDVDNLPALDAIKAVTTSEGEFLEETPQGVDVPGAQSRATVPAGAIDQTARVLDRSSAITQVTIRAESDIVYRPAVRPATPASEWRIETDLYDIDVDRQLGIIVRSLLAANARPTPRLAPTTIHLDALPEATIATLTVIGFRAKPLIGISGDLPDDIPYAHNMTSGTLTIDGHRDGAWTLTNVTLIPQTANGYRPLKLSEIIPGYPRGTTFASVRTAIGFTLTGA